MLRFILFASTGGQWRTAMECDAAFYTEEQTLELFSFLINSQKDKKTIDVFFQMVVRLSLKTQKVRKYFLSKTLVFLSFITE